MTEVLEHLISPEMGLRACHALLHNGGLLILTPPGRHNSNYSNNPLIILEKLVSLFTDRVIPPYHNLHAEREFDRRKPELQYGIHFHFSLQQLDGLLRETGFETIQRGSFEFEIYPHLLVGFLSRGDAARIAAWLSPMESRLQKIFPMNRVGQHLLWVAHKLPRLRGNKSGRRMQGTGRKKAGKDSSAWAGRS